MALKLGNIGTNTVSAIKDTGLENLLNNKTVSYYKVGSDEIINKGDFVSYNGSYMYFTAPIDYDSNIVVQSAVGMFIQDSNTNEDYPWIAYARKDATLSLCEVRDNDIRYAVNLKVDSSKSISSAYSSIVYLDDYRILWVGGSYNEGIGAYCLKYRRSGDDLILDDSSYLDLTLSCSFSSAPYTKAIKISDNTVMVVFSTGSSYNMQCVLISVNNVTMTITYSAVLSDIQNIGQYLYLCRLDDHHALISCRSGSYKRIYLATIDNNSVSLGGYCDLNNSTGTQPMGISRVSDTSAIIFYSNNKAGNTNIFISRIDVLGNSVTETNLWSDAFAYTSNIIGVDVDDNVAAIAFSNPGTDAIHFRLFDINNKNFISIEKVWEPISSLVYNASSLLRVKHGVYVIAFGKASVDVEKSVTLSLVKWDGNSLKYKNDYIQKYNGKNVVGIAAESGREGDTIPVYTPLLKN